MDRTEFGKLRVLLVGGKPHAAATLRAVLDLAGIQRITTAAEPHRALLLLREQEYDAIFCDEHVSPVDGLPFPLAARRAGGVLNPLMPLFLLCNAPPRRQVERARDDGITDVLVRPVSAATVMRKLRAALAAPRPFILAGEFFGPDRRGQGRSPFRGDDRRRRLPKKIKVTPDATSALLSEHRGEDGDAVLVLKKD